MCFKPSLEWDIKAFVHHKPFNDSFTTGWHLFGHPIKLSSFNSSSKLGNGKSKSIWLNQLQEDNTKQEFKQIQNQKKNQYTLQNQETNKFTTRIIPIHNQKTNQYTTRRQTNTKPEDKLIHSQKTNQYTTRRQTNTQSKDKPIHNQKTN